MYKLVKKFQCAGCINDGENCFEKSYSEACKNHRSGTLTSNAGHIFLGMPKGFNKVGPISGFYPEIYESYEDFEKDFGTLDFLNIPVWKWVSEENITFVKLISPRILMPHIIIINEVCDDKFDCHELTQENLDRID